MAECPRVRDSGLYHSILALIDDLHALCEVHKYVDDTTLSELIPPSCAVSNMSSSLFASLLLWTANNNMQINTSKTKEIFLGRLNPANFSRLSTATGSVERVTAFKLLVINFEANLSWSLHINTITASKHLYFLKQLKRASVSTDQLLHVYDAVVWPVLEYCTPVWHYAITHTQTEQIESTQKRAICIIFPFTCEISYPYALFAANLNSLHSRRYNISKSFVSCDPSSCVHHLLPPPRDTFVLSWLRTVTPLPRLSFRTKEHSFIIYALNNYQESTKLTQNPTLPT